MKFLTLKFTFPDITNFNRISLGILIEKINSYLLFSPGLLASEREPDPGLLDLATAVTRLEDGGWIMYIPYHVVNIIYL